MARDLFDFVVVDREHSALSERQALELIAHGRALGIPVFANDWLLGALTPFGGYHFDRLLDIERRSASRAPSTRTDHSYQLLVCRP